MAQPDALDPRAVERAIEPAEASLLRLALEFPSVYEQTAQRIAEDPFVTTPARELWKALGEMIATVEADGFDRAAFVATLDPTLAVVAQTLMARTDPLPDSDAALQQAIDQSLLTLERARLSEQIEFTRARLAEAEAAHEDGDMERLQREVLELQRRRLELDRAVADTSLLARRRIDPNPKTDQLEVAHGN